MYRRGTNCEDNKLIRLTLVKASCDHEINFQVPHNHIFLCSWITIIFSRKCLSLKYPKIWPCHKQTILCCTATSMRCYANCILYGARMSLLEWLRKWTLITLPEYSSACGPSSMSVCRMFKTFAFTSQQRQPDKCKSWGLHCGDYEEYRLLEYYAVRLL
jgi:hypothetical protein